MIIFLIFLNAKLIISDMNYICDNIYLGDSTSAKNESYLQQFNITTVINCADEIKSNYSDIKFLKLNLYDMSNENLFPQFEFAYKFIKKNADNNILIHCFMGRSRSASLVVFYLMKEKGWDYDTCIDFIKLKRPSINPNSAYVIQLKDYYENYIKK